MNVGLKGHEIFNHLHSVKTDKGYILKDQIPINIGKQPYMVLFIWFLKFTKGFQKNRVYVLIE